MHAGQVLADSLRKALAEFIRILLLGILLCAVSILFMDGWLKPFCTDIPNFYFWKCTSSLLWHIAFGFIFPIFYFIVAIHNVTKYLFFYMVQQIIAQKENTIRLSILTFLQEKSNALYLQFTKHVDMAGLSPESVMQRLLNYGSEKLLESLKPIRLWFLMLVGLQAGLLAYLLISND